MHILLVGHGRMGRLLADLAGEYGCQVAGIIDSRSTEGPAGPGSERWRGVDVALDFSSPAAVARNAAALAGQGLNLVIGTTGWHRDEPELRRVVAETGVGVVASANFSTGVVLFEALAARAAQLFSAAPEFGGWLHEAHHAGKKDAPSGTALMLQRAMVEAGFTRPLDLSSTRAGHIPGTHTIGFDGPAESVTLSHVARDRSTFARGALLAARWIQGRQGWYTMRDVLGLTG